VPTGVQGELIIILPEDATNIRIARTSLEIVDVFEARRMVDASNNYIDASLKVTERGAHKEVSFNPFKGGMVDLNLQASVEGDRSDARCSVAPSEP
jgi:hypothetical protein